MTQYIYYVGKATPFITSAQAKQAGKEWMQRWIAKGWTQESKNRFRDDEGGLWRLGVKKSSRYGFWPVIVSID